LFAPYYIAMPVSRQRDLRPFGGVQVLGIEPLAGDLLAGYPDVRLPLMPAWTWAGEKLVLTERL
jgi:hypothetical protein